MKKEIKYYVIGGQYEDYNYGGAATLLGAKRIAAQNEEHWDNWQGWHRPHIFKAEDCELKRNFYGRNYYPKANVVPEASWNQYTKKWEPYCY